MIFSAKELYMIQDNTFNFRISLLTFASHFDLSHHTFRIPLSPSVRLFSLSHPTFGGPDLI